MVWRAARRALTSDGDTSFPDAPRVVELRATANIAAGEAEHSLGAVIVREGEVVPEADVFVVRDAHRHQWMRAAADVPGAVVIETGIPVWRPSAARGHIVTYGGSRASYDAVAELLALQAEYAAWADALPDTLQGTATAEALQAIVDLDLADLADTKPPRGYGRD